MNAWRNDYTRLFIKTISEPEFTTYLPSVGIRNVSWKGEFEAACQYCGTEYSGKKCPGCQGTGAKFVLSSKAEVEFFGRLPYCIEMFYLDGSATMLVCHGECGDPRRFKKEDVILRFSEFEVVERSIPDPVILSPGETSLMTLRVVALCRAELLWEIEEVEEGVRGNG